jgi:serine/threonine protein kinase
MGHPIGFRFSSIHSKKVMHRNLKPAKIVLMADGSVKIDDFGLSKILEQTERAPTIVGTPIFDSWEMAQKQRYSYSTDLWCIGCILYKTAALQRPFAERSQPELTNNIKAKAPTPLPPIYSSDRCAIVFGLLAKDSKKTNDGRTVLRTQLHQRGNNSAVFFSRRKCFGVSAFAERGKTASLGWRRRKTETRTSTKQRRPGCDSRRSNTTTRRRILSSEVAILCSCH